MLTFISAKYLYKYNIFGVRNSCWLEKYSTYYIYKICFCDQEMPFAYKGVWVAIVRVYRIYKTSAAYIAQ